MCKNSCRQNVKKLSSVYNIRQNKVFKNQERKFYCSEVCMNLWRGIELEVNVLKPRLDDLETNSFKLVSGELKSKKPASKILLKNLSIFQDILKFQKTLDQEKTGQDQKDHVPVQAQPTLIRPIHDEIKFYQEIQKIDIAPDLDKVSVSSSENASMFDLEDEKLRLQEQFEDLEVTEPPTSRKKENTQTETDATETEATPNILQDFQNLYTSWLTPTLKLDFKPREVNLQKMVIETQGTGRYIKLPNMSDVTDSCASSSDLDNITDKIEAIDLKDKQNDKFLSHRKKKFRKKKSGQKDSDISEKRIVLPNFGHGETQESIQSTRNQILSQQISHLLSKSNLLDKNKLNLLFTNSCLLVNKYFNLNMNNIKINNKFKDHLALFLLVALQVYMNFDGEKILDFVNEENLFVLKSEYYSYLKSDVNNLYEKMVFGVKN